MNTLEPLNPNAVISLDNPDDKFHSANCTFRASEIRYALYRFLSRPRDKWFSDGVTCEVLMPNHDWRTGKVTFQLCFVEDQPENKEPESQESETKSTPLLFKPSTGSIELLDKTGVVSLDEGNESFQYITRTCLLSQIEGTVLKTYEPNESGYKWLGEGVPCSVLSPNTSWRKGKVSLQACFIEDLVEEELVEEELAVTEESEASSDEAELDTTTEVLSPLDEIRQMAADPS
jgi:KGK domain